MKNNRLTYITMQVKGSVIEAEVAHQLPTRVVAFSNLMRFTMEQWFSIVSLPILSNYH